MTKIRIVAVPSYGKCVCGGVFVERVAQHGPNAGSHFLGCSRYPECTATAGDLDPDGGEHEALRIVNRGRGFVDGYDDVPAFDEVHGYTPGDQ